MPSADMYPVTNINTSNTMIKGTEFNISSKDVEGLVMEIKENLRLSAGSKKLKAISCSHISRKTSRASPYCIPGKVCCDSAGCATSCGKVNKHRSQQETTTEDPYEFLQQLLKDGSLVNEAVRRLKLGLTPKQQFFYDSDEESKSPLIRIFPQEN